MSDRVVLSFGPLLSLREVADELGVCERTVRRMIARGDVPAIRAGARQLRVPAADLRDYLVRQREPAA